MEDQALEKNKVALSLKMISAKDFAKVESWNSFEIIVDKTIWVPDQQQLEAIFVDMMTFRYIFNLHTKDPLLNNICSARNL